MEENIDFSAENDNNYGNYNVIDGEVYDLKGNKLNKYDTIVINNITKWMQKEKYGDYNAKMITIKPGMTDIELSEMDFGASYVSELLEVHPLDETKAICDFIYCPEDLDFDKAN